MKVGIPIFRNVVSPRLDIADGLLIYNIDNDVVNKKEKCSLNFDQPAQLISILQKNEITTIICGGCSQFFLRNLVFFGFDVVSGLTGDPDHIVQIFAAGKLNNGNSDNSPANGPFGRSRRRKRQSLRGIGSRNFKKRGK
jgi:hypothetical protein